MYILYLRLLLLLYLTCTGRVFKLASVIVAVWNWSNWKEGYNLDLTLLHHLLKFLAGFINNFVRIDEVIDSDEVENGSHLINDWL